MNFNTNVAEQFELQLDLAEWALKQTGTYVSVTKRILRPCKKPIKTSTQ